MLQGGCIIRAGFLDDIKQAYDRNKDLKNLLVDEFFARKLAEKNKPWRSVVTLAITNGVSTPGLVSSLAYFDTYRSGVAYFQQNTKLKLRQALRTLQ